MNCKPGDMAVVVRGFPSINIGKLVTVIAIVERSFGEAMWSFEGNLVDGCGKKLKGVSDVCLRPIRNDPGDDVTLTWAPVPEKVAA